MKKVIKNFEHYFRAISYAVALCGLFSLFFSGGIGVIILAFFIGLTVLAWFLEDTRWQISERVGVGLILLVIPLFFLDWKYKLTGFGTKEILAAGSLARLILFLSAIKLLQKKSDRDWIFIYIISFFEILLAAGLSISPLYILSLGSFLLFTACAIIAFEIRKTSREVSEKQDRNLKKESLTAADPNAPLFRLPLVAVALLLLTTLFAVPVFFSLPRVGGAGIGGDLSQTTKVTGFSDSVSLGDIGRLQQNDQIVMRVRIDKNDNQTLNRFLWRGIALDTFDNRNWSKSKLRYKEPYMKLERGYFLLNYASENSKTTLQTVYLEPLNTDIIFALSKPLSLQGGFQVVNKDSEGAISGIRNGFERISYTVYSDTTLPSVAELRRDNAAYEAKDARYLQLPEKIDGRIAELADRIVKEAGAANRYEKASAIERFLQNEFGYTLEMKAGGDEPLADFLFNVREGHCEYFATAMAVMLRTQGIATRIVNGFQQGEYNETAEVYVVRQKNAHSWVEVYFPETDAWMPFDPTPFAGQFAESTDTSIYGSINNYLEALETFWIQYFVAYDNQEQQSLFRSVKSSFAEFKSTASIWLNSLQAEIQKWWEDVRGDKGLQASLFALLYGIGFLIALILGIVFLIWLFRRIKKLSVWHRIFIWLKSRNRETRIIEFYERMQRVLAGRGFKRKPDQTPLEFAFALNMPEAVKITEKYNRVRFGEKNLSNEESKEIENWLKNLETTKRHEKNTQK
jgi:protein-glutamine gamma-glutamyltransferase